MQPRHSPSADSIHISVRQIRHIVRGSGPRMPLFVMTVIASAITRPSVHANRLGLADTHSGARPSVIARARTPTGLYRSPSVTRIRNSAKNRLAAT